jgi:hypothetical protein
MNERVRQLVRQAGLDDADFPIENWDNVPLAKFAQLIVKECALTAGLMEHEGRKNIGAQILNNFGVEE